MIIDKVPPELEKEYTLDYQVPIVYNLMDDTATNTTVEFNIDQLNYYGEICHKKEVPYYYKTTDFLYEFFEKENIKNKLILNIGSTLCFYESMCLYYGAIPYTLTYEPIINKIKEIKNITYKDLSKEYYKKFDYIFSISVFEHTGLGRYGDKLDPNGDLKSISYLRNFLKDDGKFVLAVPVGTDVLVWNACRIYGKKRLTLLLKDFEIINFYKNNIDEWVEIDSRLNFLSHQSLLENLDKIPINVCRRAFIQPLFILGNKL